MCYTRRHRYDTYPERSRRQPPEVRIADEDRERAITRLGDHAATGRLSADELDQRADHALAAQTRGELDALFFDLPSGPPRAVGARDARATRDRYVRAKLSLVAAGGALWGAVALLHHVA
jgi:hypothetical protein